jgi:hypothetical protein
VKKGKAVRQVALLSGSKAHDQEQNLEAGASWQDGESARGPAKTSIGQRAKLLGAPLR